MRKLEANNNVLSKSNMINFQLKIMEMCSLKLWNTILDMSWRVQTYTTFKNNSKKNQISQDTECDVGLFLINFYHFYNVHIFLHF